MLGGGRNLIFSEASRNFIRMFTNLFLPEYKCLTKGSSSNKLQLENLTDFEQGLVEMGAYAQKEMLEARSKGHSFVPMSELPAHDLQKAQPDTVYLSADRSYVVRDPRGVPRQGKLPQDSGIDMNGFENKLDDAIFKGSFLNFMKQSYIRPNATRTDVPHTNLAAYGLVFLKNGKIYFEYTTGKSTDNDPSDHSEDDAKQAMMKKILNGQIVPETIIKEGYFSFRYFCTDSDINPKKRRDRMPPPCEISRLVQSQFSEMKEVDKVPVKAITLTEVIIKGKVYDIFVQGSDLIKKLRGSVNPTKCPYSLRLDKTRDTNNPEVMTDFLLRPLKKGEEQKMTTISLLPKNQKGILQRINQLFPILLDELKLKKGRAPEVSHDDRTSHSQPS